MMIQYIYVMVIYQRCIDWMCHWGVKLLTHMRLYGKVHKVVIIL